VVNGGRGRFLEVKVVDQFNGNNVLFVGRAGAGDKEKLFGLLKNLRFKGVDLPYFIDEKKK